MKKNLLLSLMLFLGTASFIKGQTGISFSLENGQITSSSGIYYYEFDIMAFASENSQFYIAQIYLNYNIMAFGTSVSSNTTISKGTLLSSVLHGDFLSGNYAMGTYSISKNDNTSNTLAIQNEHMIDNEGSFSESGFELSNTLGTTPKVWIHVKMRIQNQSQTSNIQFNTSISQWDLQNYYYTMPVSNATANYSPVNISSGIDQPLPMELTSFKGDFVNNKVLLCWKTASEIDNYEFEIQRKVISQKAEVNSWENIGFVLGSGNSNSSKEYQFVDKELFGGSKFIYRLKQLDNDGHFIYSDEIEIEAIPEKYNLSQNYPNPFNPTTNIEFQVVNPGLVILKVYDMLGNEVATLINKDFEAGFYKYQWNATGLSSGIYFYQLKAGRFVQTKKLILMK